MKVHVDSERCQGHSRCADLVPALFEIDEYGFASAAGDGTVGEELVRAARLAVASCPERAITLFGEA